MAPLFRSLERDGSLSERRFNRHSAWGVEVAQYLAGHAKTETTKLHDRREERVSLDEIERIGI